jgi:AAA+ ATPase superfamily predicted ATPase
MNPFVVKGYAGPEYFCDREKETGRLREALLNNRDITLVSLRKMGKTGLIHHVSGLMEKEGTFEILYLDILHTQNLQGLINQLATAVYRLKKPAGKKVRDFISAFRHLRPVISVDPFSGLPSVSVQVSGERERETTLEELFVSLGERGNLQPLLVAIDEFQQIARYPEKNTEALLRGIIQSLPHLRFIFSGSNKSMLQRIFSDASRPFYQSTEMVYLSEIPEEAYMLFVRNQFVQAGRKTDERTLTELMRLTRRHTWYLQFLCNGIYASGMDLNRKALMEVFSDTLLGFEPFYLEYRSLLTHHQWQLLKAIARSETADAIMAGDFIRTFNLTNASTVKRSAESLLAREMVYQCEEGYRVYDVFFSRWLEQMEL